MAILENETVKQEEITEEIQEQEQEQEQEEKKFTQAELDKIINDRITRERKKYSDYENLKNEVTRLKSLDTESIQKEYSNKINDLEKQIEDMKKADEIRELKEKIYMETGVPASLLTGEDEESCKAQAQSILAFAGKRQGYPTIKDAGEIQRNVKGNTKQQFADWWQTVTE